MRFTLLFTHLFLPSSFYCCCCTLTSLSLPSLIPTFLHFSPLFCTFLHFSPTFHTCNMGNLLSSPEEREDRRAQEEARIEQERLRKAQQDAAMYQRVIEYRRQQELARERARQQEQQEREKRLEQERMRQEQERMRQEQERMRQEQERERARLQKEELERWYAMLRKRAQERQQAQLQEQERERARRLQEQERLRLQEQERERERQRLQEQARERARLELQEQERARLEEQRKVQERLRAFYDTVKWDADSDDDRDYSIYDDDDRDYNVYDDGNDDDYDRYNDSDGQDDFYHDDYDEYHHSDFFCRPKPISSSHPHTTTLASNYKNALSSNIAPTDYICYRVSTSTTAATSSTIPQVTQTNTSTLIDKNQSPVYYGDHNDQGGYAYVKPTQDDNWRTRRRTEKAEQSAKSCGRRKRGRKARGDLYEDDYHAGHTKQEIQDKSRQQKAGYEARRLSRAAK
ncbi:MAG: hypothetical protein J3Q66DRAFT_334587 [Benniella sp.]|nr:MAG: hypothetical protein J3Q66DRAFT_334587 [Benniella sp.]